MGDFLNYATHATQDLALRALRQDITHRTQRNELLHDKDIAYNVQNGDIQSCCFVCSSVKKASPPKTKGIHFGQEILFHTHDERGEFSLFSVRARP